VAAVRINVKVKSTLHTVWRHGGSRGMDPLILNVGARRSGKPHALPPGTHWTGSWVGLKLAVPGVLENRQNTSYCRYSNFHHPARSLVEPIPTRPTLYRLFTYTILYIYIYIYIYISGADKSLARPGRKQARKHVRDARDFNNIETRAVIKFFFYKARRRRNSTPFWQRH